MGLFTPGETAMGEEVFELRELPRAVPLLRCECQRWASALVLLGENNRINSLSEKLHFKQTEAPNLVKIKLIRPSF